MNIIDESKLLQDKLVGIRRDLHRIPENGFTLPKTRKYIMDRLDTMGIEFTLNSRSQLQSKSAISDKFFSFSKKAFFRRSYSSSVQTSRHFGSKKLFFCLISVYKIFPWLPILCRRCFGCSFQISTFFSADDTPHYRSRSETLKPFSGPYAQECVSKQTVSTPHEEMRLILIPCACTQISPRNISTVFLFGGNISTRAIRVSVSTSWDSFFTKSLIYRLLLCMIVPAS